MEPRKWNGSAYEPSGVWDLTTGEWLPRWPVDVRELLKHPDKFSTTQPVAAPVEVADEPTAELAPRGRRKG